MQVDKSVSALDRPSERVHALTRIVAAIIIPFLVAAFIILFFFPSYSGQRFAWEIKPAMTAVWMGTGYMGGAYFFLRVALEKRWHRVAAGFLPVTAFTWGMLLATVLHRDRFDPAHLPFQIWLVLYLVTPFLVPLIWWRNRAEDDGSPEPNDLVVPAVFRAVMGVVSLLMLASLLVAFIAPEAIISFWPWTLTPLTARVLGGWFGLMCVGGYMMARERRWSGWRIPLESIIFVWHGLLLLGAFMNLADFKPGGWWFLAAESATLLGLLAFYLFMQSKRPRRS